MSDARRLRHALALLLCACLPTFGGCNGCACAIRCDRVSTAAHDGATPRVDAGGLPGVASETALARGDFCGNGLDDDGNGAIDDGCPCVFGATASCYGGDARFAGIGACRLGTRHCIHDGSATAWSSCDAWAAPQLESCPGGFDEDCDGRIDESCTARDGATQACFAGAPEQLGVGRCHAGTQTTVSLPMGPDGSVVVAWGACDGALGPTAEVCNGTDDDCNGAVDDIPEVCDLRDDDCDGAIDEEGVCDVAAIGHGAYWSRFYRSSPSGLLPPSAGLYTLTALSGVPVPCVAGEVVVEEPVGVLTCVPVPPADCPVGTQHQWDGDAWQCVPCDLLVQFGTLFDGERTCAPSPMTTCPPGDTPTYLETTRAWTCIATCHNGTYDAHYYAGVLVCIPC